MTTKQHPQTAEGWAKRLMGGSHEPFTAFALDQGDSVLEVERDGHVLLWKFNPIDEVWVVGGQITYTELRKAWKATR